MKNQRRRFTGLAALLLFVMIVGSVFLLGRLFTFTNGDVMRSVERQPGTRRQRSGLGQAGSALREQDVPAPSRDLRRSRADVASRMPTRARTGAPDVLPPSKIMTELVAMFGMDPQGFLEERERYRHDPVHQEWIARLRAALRDLDGERADALVETHLAWLHMQDVLDKAYLSGGIDHDAFTSAVDELMRWNQRAFESTLSEAEYESLFERSPEDVDRDIDTLVSQIPRYRFILERDQPSEDVVRGIGLPRLEELNVEFKRVVLAADEVRQRADAGAITAEAADHARRLEREAFVARAKEILSPEEIDAVFGSVENLERGVGEADNPGGLTAFDLGFFLGNLRRLPPSGRAGN